jgi:hypothetical protein
MSINRKPLYANIAIGLKAHKIAHTKADILAGYGVESMKELTDKQLQELSQWVDGLYKDKVKEVPREIRDLRSKVILAAEKYLNTKISDTESWKRFNELMLSPKIAGKMLIEMDEEQLKAVLAKLQIIGKKQKQKVEHENYDALWN